MLLIGEKPAAEIALDELGKIIMWHETAERTLGYHEEEIRGKTITSFMYLFIIVVF